MFRARTGTSAFIFRHRAHARDRDVAKRNRGAWLILEISIYPLTPVAKYDILPQNAAEDSRYRKV